MADFFFFIDKPSWEGQELTSQKAFGVVDEDSYRLQSTFKFSSSTQNLAIAVCKSLVLIQESDGNPDLVNIALKPIDPVDWEYDGIAYFIYRGIRRDSLIIANDDSNTNIDFPEVIAASIVQGAPDLKTSIIENKKNLNKDINNQDRLNEPVIPRHLGYEYSKNVAPDSSDYAPDNQLLEDVFFKENTDNTFQLPIVSAGAIIGQFNYDNFSGFEIIGDRMGNEATMGVLRVSEEHILNVSNYSDVEKKHHKQKVLNYFDAAAFYGNFYRQEIDVLGFNEANSLYSEELNGGNILQFFLNKNKVYIDIRHQTGYSYNFYNNFYYENESIFSPQHHILSSFSPDGTLLGGTLALSYGSSDWPIFSLNNITVNRELGENPYYLSFLNLVASLSTIYPTFNVAKAYNSPTGVEWKDRSKGHIKERSIFVYGKSLSDVYDYPPEENFEGGNFFKSMHLLNYDDFINAGEDTQYIGEAEFKNTTVKINLVHTNTGTISSYYNIKMLIDFKSSHHSKGITPRHIVRPQDPVVETNLKNSLLRHDDHILDLMFPIFEMRQVFQHKPGRVSVRLYSSENAFMTSGTYGYYYDQRYLPKIGIAEDDNNITFFAYINEKDIYESANVNNHRNIINLTSFTIPEQADFLFGLTKRDLNVTLQKQDVGTINYRDLIRDTSGNITSYDTVSSNPKLLFYLENNSINDGVDFELDYEYFDCITLTKNQFNQLKTLKNNEFGEFNDYRVYLGIRYDSLYNKKDESALIGRYRLMLKGVVESSGEPKEKHVQTDIFIYTKITDERKEPSSNYKTF